MITAYRLCQQSISDSNQRSITISYQQKLLYTLDKWTDADPRKLFITDIIKLVQDIEEDTNNLCILMWDVKESVDDPSNEIRKLLTDTSLVDTFSQIAGEPGPIAT
jgi:hypothetical protein